MQLTLLDEQEPWRTEWIGMPEFVQEDLTPHQSVTVHFATEYDARLFGELLEQVITPRTKSLWFPSVPSIAYTDKRYVSE